MIGNVGTIIIEFCIACSKRHSAGHFGTKIRYLAQFLTGLLQILSFKNMHYENLNLLSNFIISKFCMQLHIKVGVFHGFR